MEVTDSSRQAKKALEESEEEVWTREQPKAILRKPRRRAKKSEAQTFHFFFKRTCFRTLVFYFKRIFTPFLHEQNIIEYSPSDRNEVLRVNNAIRCFAIAHFPGLLIAMQTEESKKEFLLYLKIILFSHRYQKSQEYLKLE